MAKKLHLILTYQTDPVHHYTRFYLSLLLIDLCCTNLIMLRIYAEALDRLV